MCDLLATLVIAGTLYTACFEPAEAQNTQCANRPVGDSTNACANTRFVTTGFVAGPGSSVVGNIAYWNNTTGSALGATPAYQAGNPANSSLYSVVAVPPAAFTGVYNALQISQGTFMPASQQYGVTPLMQGIVGTSVSAAGDTTTYEINGVAGYARADSSPTAGVGRNAVGVLGWAYIGAASGNAFGGNMGATNNTGSCISACADGFDVNYISGLEVNINLWQKAGPVDPTINSGHAYGITIAGSGNLSAAVTGSAGVVINKMSVGTNLPWTYGVQTLDGAATNALSAGKLATGSSQPSQKVLFNATNAGGTDKQAYINADLNGTLQLVPALATILYDGSVAASLIVQSGLGSAGVQLTKLSSAGIVTNDASGNLSSSAVGTGVLTFLATPSSANLASAVTDETGTGALVFGTSPTFTTSILLPAGSVGSPAATFSGDTNNGWWSPAADTQAWSTAGNERMRLTSAGDVGIGITSPSTYKITNKNLAVGDDTANPTSAQIAFVGQQTVDGTLGDLTFHNAAIGSGTKRVGFIRVRRSGADDSGQLSFWVYAAGTPSQAVTINNSGGMTVGATTDAGVGAVLANTSLTSTTYTSVGTKIRAGGSAPTISAGCNGAGSSISGSDLAGHVTGQTAAATTCTITFNSAYASTPYCTASGLTSPLTGAITPSTTTLVVNFASTANYQFTYQCFARSGG